MHPLMTSHSKPSSRRPPASGPHRGNSRRSSLVSQYLEKKARESDISPSSLRPSQEYRRSSHTTASTGFYLPPPGYVDSGLSCDLDKEIRSPQNDSYGLPLPPSAGTRHPYSGGLAWGQPSIGKNAAAQWMEENVMPALSHHDWSIPQAKQILSHWATLATLLAGTQATLLAYYSKIAEEDSFVPNMVFAFSCAGLMLEVYGALLAAGTIVASISLQAVHPITASCPHPAKKPLSPRATAILDRMTVTCGYVIPLGAICQLCALALFASKYQNRIVVIAMGIALASCISATGLAAFSGWRAGSERLEVMQDVRERARYWDQGRRYSTPDWAAAGSDKIENADEEAARLIHRSQGERR